MRGLTLFWHVLSQQKTSLIEKNYGFMQLLTRKCAHESRYQLGFFRVNDSVSPNLLFYQLKHVLKFV
jgi:hypothetical protein